MNPEFESGEGEVVERDEAERKWEISNRQPADLHRFRFEHQYLVIVRDELTADQFLGRQPCERERTPEVHVRGLVEHGVEAVIQRQLPRPEAEVRETPIGLLGRADSAARPRGGSPTPDIVGSRDRDFEARAVGTTVLVLLDQSHGRGERGDSSTDNKNRFLVHA